MRAKSLGEGRRVLVFDPGESVVSELTDFAARHRITAASFQAIGAFRRVTLGYFDLEKKDYRRIPIDEQVEVVSLTGNVALHGTDTKIHAHVVVARSDGTAHGGHLLEATVRPTLEVVLQEMPAEMTRRSDPETGLALIDL